MKNKKKFPLYWISLFFLGCAHVPAGPFAGMSLDDIGPESRRIITEANEDFIAVIEGRVPVHARPDEKLGGLLDGGTVFYRGNKYHLTAVNSYTNFGDLNCMVTGPIISFDEDFSVRTDWPLSQVRVVPIGYIPAEERANARLTNSAVRK